MTRPYSGRATSSSATSTRSRHGRDPPHEQAAGSAGRARGPARRDPVASASVMVRVPVAVAKVVSSTMVRVEVAALHRWRRFQVRRTGPIDQCPADGSSSRPKTDGPSTRGQHSHSIEPDRSTSAIEWQSEMRAWSPIGVVLTHAPSNRGVGGHLPATTEGRHRARHPQAHLGRDSTIGLMVVGDVGGSDRFTGFADLYDEHRPTAPDRLGPLLIRYAGVPRLRGRPGQRYGALLPVGGRVGRFGHRDRAERRHAGHGRGAAHARGDLPGRAGPCDRARRGPSRHRAGGAVHALDGADSDTGRGGPDPAARWSVRHCRRRLAAGRRGRRS